MTEEEYVYLKKKIRELTRYELDNYGSKQMMRRLEGFITRSGAAGVAQYCRLLENNPQEVEKLQDFLTINVSEFFRDFPYFKELKEKILPVLLKNNLQLNIWSAGCSNGAEAYSVAIMLDELSPYRTHRILATDIDKNVLIQAAAGGPYREPEVRNALPEIMNKYFTHAGDSFNIVDSIRKKVIFKQQDLTRDPFESNFDLIICRNVVIYFTDEAKKKLRKRFMDALKPDGILFIGATETMLDASDTGFIRLSPCFYRRVADSPLKSKPTTAVKHL